MHHSKAGDVRQDAAVPPPGQRQLGVRSCPTGIPGGGGGRARSLYAIPPPPRVLRDNGLGACGANGAQFFLRMLPFHQTIHALSARYLHPPKPPDTHPP